MPLTGKDLVALIQGNLEASSRKDQQTIRDDVAKAAAPLLERYRLGSYASEIFDLFRKFEAKFDPREGNLREKALADELLRWGVPSFDQALQLADELHDVYKLFRTPFLNTRSITAHVGAVLRPFKRRYLDGWDDAGVNGFNLEETLAEVERLKNKEVSSEAELLAWSTMVYELFFRVAVMPEGTYGTLGSGETKPRRPLGMIGFRSERTYRQQWTTWIKENTNELLSGVSDSAKDPKQIPADQELEGFAQAARDDYYAPDLRSTYLQKNNTSFTRLPDMDRFFNSILVRVSDANDAGLVAEQTWQDRDTAIREVSNWISNLILFWGSGRTAVIQLEFSKVSGDSKFSLPAIAMDVAAERIQTVLKADI